MLARCPADAARLVLDVSGDGRHNQGRAPAPVRDLGLVAVWLLASSLRSFRRNRNDPRPWREDTALVEESLYRHTRNPMYLGMALAYATVALAFNALWPLLLLVPVEVRVLGAARVQVEGRKGHRRRR